MRDLKTCVWGRIIRLAAKAAVGIALVAGGTAMLAGTAQARDGHGHGGGHWGGHGGGHWGGHGYWRGGGWGPSWGLSIGFPGYYPGYYDPYYYPRTVVVERPVYATNYAPGYAWPVYNQAAYTRAMSAPLGEEVAWNDGKSSGSVTATRDGQSGDRYCREFQQSIIIDGKRQQAFGAACQTPDGGWEIVPDTN